MESSGSCECREGLKLPAVFLDRDGVINADRLDYVKSWEEFQFLPCSLEALAALSKARYRIVVITNQSAVGRGLLTEAALQQIHTRMIERVRATGGRIDAVYYCPHTPNARCYCRKPAPGLFLEAARNSGIDLTSSWAIGDSHRDVEAANRAGVQAILLDRSLPDASATDASPGRFLRATDLLDAVRIVLEGRNRHADA
jgi:histidinol-phosphate phosphatase family protein